MGLTENEPSFNVEVVIATLSRAVQGLTGVVDSLRDEVHKGADISARLEVRCGQLEKTASDLNRYLFTGNGQPPLIAQLTSIREQLLSLSKSLLDFEDSRVSQDQLRTLEQSFNGKLELLRSEVNQVRDTQEETEKEFEKKEENRAITKTQFLVFGLGLLGSIITGIGSLLISLFRHS